MVWQHMNSFAYRKRAAVSGTPIMRIAFRMRLSILELSASQPLRLEILGGMLCNNHNNCHLQSYRLAAATAAAAAATAAAAAAAATAAAAAVTAAAAVSHSLTRGVVLAVSCYFFNFTPEAIS
jgi:hypothetical protein